MPTTAYNALRRIIIAAAMLLVSVAGTVATTLPAHADVTLSKASGFIEVTWEQPGTWPAKVGDDPDVKGILTATVRCSITFVESDTFVTSSTCFDPESWLVKEYLNKDFASQISDYSSVGKDFAYQDRKLGTAKVSGDGSALGILVGNGQNPVGFAYSSIKVKLPKLGNDGSASKAEYAEARANQLAIVQVKGVKAPYLTVSGTDAHAGDTVKSYYYGEYSGGAENRKSHTHEVGIAVDAKQIDIDRTGTLPYTAVGGPVMNADNELVGIMVESASDARSIHMTKTSVLRKFLAEYGIQKSTPTNEPSASSEPTNQPSASVEPSSEPTETVASDEPTAEPTDDSTSESTYEPPAKVHQPSEFGKFLSNAWLFFVLLPFKLKLMAVLLVVALLAGALYGISSLVGKIRGKGNDDAASTDDSSLVEGSDAAATDEVASADDDTTTWENPDLVDTLVHDDPLYVDDAPSPQDGDSDAEDK